MFRFIKKNSQESASETFDTATPFRIATWKEDCHVLLFAYSRSAPTYNAKLEAEVFDKQLITTTYTDYFARFIGCVIDNSSWNGVLYDFPTRGSLSQLLLSSSRFPLDAPFKYRLMLGICEGLHAIHQFPSIGSHGRLTSKSIFLDAK